MKERFSAKKVAGKEGKRRLAASVIAFILVGFSFVMLSGYYGRVANAAPLTATGFLSDSYLGAARGMRYLMSALFGSANSSAPNSAFACTLTQQITVSGCYYTTGSKATVSVEVAWTGATSADTITVSLDGGAQTRTISPEDLFDPGSGSAVAGPIKSPQVVAFEITADGASHSITSTAAGANSCTTGATTFNAPAGCAPNLCASGELGGTVFFDYDADGVKDSGETNGASGVTVTAFDVNGTTYTATSDSYGRYEFSAANSNAIPGGSYPVRLEFTNLPASGLQTTTPHGTNNATSVQFASAAACTYDVGVMDQTGFCQGNPYVILPCYANGDPAPNVDANDAGDLDALVAFPYSASGGPTPGIMLHLATARQVGSLWGTAYNKFTKRMFSSAMLRRHVGLGPLGLGGIYVTNMTNPGSATTANFIDVTTLGVNLGQASVPSVATRGLSRIKTDPSHDTTVFGLVGKVGIGDLDISEDGNTLWFVNLNDKKLYSIDISAYNGDGTTLPTAANVSSTTIPSPGCANGEHRPWGTKVYQGKVYVGSVCDGSAGTTSDMRARVSVFDPGATTWNTAFDFPLTYPKGYAFNNAGDTPENTGWYRWTDSFAEFSNNLGTFGGASLVVHPQPILSDIEFDIDGSLVIGLGDRGGMQMGYFNYGPVSPSTTLYATSVGGDVLRAFFSNGSYVLENNAKAGPNTGVGANNNQGPGFGEFYDDNWTIGSVKPHTEHSIGALAIKPGSGEVVSVVVDPVNGTPNSAGVRWLNNSTGVVNRSYAVYSDSSNVDDGLFGKASGLGDVELNCNSASYLEIGNRIWMDGNANGIQDPGEMPISGVTLHLYTPNGKDGIAGNADDLLSIATAVTDSTGAYYFTSADANNDGIPDNDTVLTNNVGLVGGGTANPTYPGIQPNTRYVIRADRAADFTTGGALFGKNITQANIGNGALGAPEDLRDSDASSANVLSIAGGNFPEIEVQHLVGAAPANGTGAFGEDDHTMDMGFVALSCTVAGADTVCNGSTNTYSVTTNPDPLTNPTYSWTIANGSGANASIIGATNGSTVMVNSGTNAGTYTVMVTITSVEGTTSCSLTATINNVTPGVIAADQTLCSPANPAAFTVPTPATGAGALTYQWQSSTTDCSTGFTDIPGATSATYDAPAGLTQTTYYRRIVTSTLNTVACPAISNCVTVFINNVTPGTVAGDQSVCSGGDPVAFTVPTPATGSGTLTYQWQSSTTDCSTGFSNIPGATGAAYDPPSGLTQKTYYRRITTSTLNGQPCTATSNCITVDINPNPTAAAGPDQELCLAVTQPTVFNLNGTATNGTVAWSVQSSTGTAVASIVNGTTLTPTINVTGTGTVTLRLTVTSNTTPSCGTATDDVVLTVSGMSIGNIVWKDLDNDGIRDTAPAEPVIDGVVMNLYRESNGTPGLQIPGDTLVGSQTTAGGGLYNFINLPCADYYVQAAASNFVAPAGALAGCFSTPGNVTGNSDLNDRDHGVDNPNPSTNGIASTVITLSLHGEPGVGTDGDGDNGNLTADFGFAPAYTLGNRVWKDLDNSGTINGAETGINGVVLRLLTSPGLVQATDINGVLVPDQTTANGGYYRFTNLPTGDYVVEVRASNFTAPGVLAGCVSSGPDGNDPDTDVDDSDDNGVGTAPDPTNGIRSLPVTVGPAIGSEPTNETDIGPGDPAEPNGNTNLTVDFGFAPIFSLGNRVWKDLDNSGTINGGETGVNGVVLRLLSSPALTQATDVAGVLVPDQTTANGGYYRFDNLASGDYVVEVRSSNFTAPGTLAGCVSVLSDAGDPDTDVDDSDDNGVGVVPGANGIRSLPVTLGPQPGSEPTTETDRGPGDPVEPNGATNLTLDFGFAPIFTLGNRVWKDLDNSGTINGGEAGIDGVVLRLLTSPGLVQATDMNGALVPDQTTANGGYYRFVNLLAGDYVIEVRSSNFTAPGVLAGCVSSGPGGNDPDTDVDDSDDNGVGTAPNPTTGIRSLPVSVGPNPGSEPTNETDLGPADPAEPNGGTNQTVDFGFAPIFSLGNRVWKDTDNSGTLNGAETGINGVVLRLLSSPALTQATDVAGVLVPDQTTANGGYYRFDNLPSGDYVVEVRSSNFTAPGTLAGCVSSLADAGDPDTDVDDNDDNGIGVVPGANGIRSNPVTLGPQPGSEPTTETDRGPGDPAEPNGATNLTLDFGFAPIYSLGNRVWKDTDNSGTINGAEVGVNGVVLRLLTSPGLTQATDMNGALVADQTTANGGYYRFDNILAGDYVVEVRSSNFTSPGALTGCVSVLNDAGDPDTDVDDSDDNGVGVIPGANGVRSNPVTLGPQPGSEPTTEADRSPSDPVEPNGATNLTLDFGFAPIYSLGNRVWKDVDNSGTINGAEVGVNGVVLRLLTSPGLVQATDATGALVPDQTTANGGYYRFDNILAGDYVVEVRSSNFTAPGALAGCVSVLSDAGDPDTDVDDSDDNGVGVAPGANGIRSLPITLGPQPGSEPINETDRGPSDPAEPNGNTNLTLDFGFAPIYSLGNRIWKDLNNSGTIDAADGASPGVNGVVVRLLTSPGLTQATDMNGALVPDQTTANGGYYRFDNILGGNYVVEVRSSNFTAPGTLAGCVSVLTDETNPDNNVDSNDNGIGVSPGANGIRSNPVTLGPQPGSEPTNETDRSPSDPAEPNGATNLTVDFGFAPIFSLGNRVWKDLDNSGTINGAEVGINGVVLRLLTSPGLTQATDMNGALVPDQTTANGGYYRFDNILGGDYVVEVRSTNFTSPGVLTGCVTSTGANGLVGATGPNEPAPDADANPADSDDNGESVAGAVRSKPVTLGLAPGSEPTNETDRSPSDPAEPNGATNLTVDFGFTTPMNLGNLVWKDLDLDGIRDTSPLEPGIDGVKVVLWADNGNGVFSSTTDTMLTMVNTSGGGTYSFTNILPGNYFVVVDQSNFGGANVLGSCLSSFGVDTGDQVDNNDNGVDNQTPVTSGVASSLIILTDGAEPTNDGDGPNGNLTIDFGFIFPSDFAFGGAPGSGVPGKAYEGDACNGATGAYVLTFRNNGPAPAIPGAILTDVIPTGITPLSVSGSAGWSCSIAGQTVTCTSTAPFAVNAVAQFRITVAIGYKISGSVTNTATIAYAGDPVNPNNSASATINVVNGVGAPGQAFENNGSSVLVYPIYTSSASSPNEQNTRINLTNIQDQKSICVHLFFVDGASCSVADSIVCLTPNQTTSFLASDLDPGSTGYIVAVAIDCNGCPTNFNFLVGDEFVKFASGHRGNVIAEGVAALPGLPTCDNNSVIAELKFDGTQYGRFGRVLAMDNFGSRADGNDTMMIVDRIGGNLGIGASTLGTLFGILYDDSEAGVSFNVTGQCQLRSSLSNNFPRTTPRFETFIPAGRTGWLKLFSQSDVALVGASINYNANSTAQLGAFSGAHNLHKLTLSSAGSYIIPVFPAQGCQ